MGKLTKPLLGVFAGVTPTGYIWYDTIRYRARDARTATGQKMEGRRLKDGRTIDNAAAGWAFAKSEGFRIERVDVLPSGRAALSEGEP
jgi:hypothetical protein